MLIGSPYLMPTIAVVDPLLTVSSPPGVTAATGVDALVHAIEAYVSVKRQPMTDIFCLSAIELLSQNIRQAWSNGNNLEAREKMMLGALQAGIAFSNSSVALVHGMSRPIGAYFHIAHGVSNAALLAVVSEFSLIGDPQRYADIAATMGEPTEGLSVMEAADLSVKAIRRMVSDIKIPSLQALGVERERLMELAGTMADAAIDSGSPANNPRKPTRQEIVDLYRLAYDS
jgi:alcohol dehydrogenase class IV